MHTKEKKKKIKTVLYFIYYIEFVFRTGIIHLYVHYTAKYLYVHNIEHGYIIIIIIFVNANDALLNRKTRVCATKLNIRRGGDMGRGRR